MVRHYLIWIVAMAASPMLISCQSTGEVKPTMTTTALTLEITSGAAFNLKQDELNVTARLTNVSVQPLQINRRLGISRFDRGGELSFEIRDASGQAVPFSARVNIGTPGDEHFGAIRPGEAVERSISLSKYFPVLATGSYTLVATYKNEYQSSDEGNPTWKGTVVSPSATFEIAP